jgi:hypothetical protein
MPNFRIIYPKDTGGLEIIVPAIGQTQESALDQVPTGSVYKIINVTDMPVDPFFRDAWQADFTDCDVKE